VGPHEGQYLAILGVEELERAAPERTESLAQRDHAPHPRQERMRVVVLRLDVHRLVVVLVVHYQRQV
jgi:hypothetical protein